MKTIERESAFLILVLQSGVGLLTAAGPFLLSLGGSPGNLILGILAVLLSVGELLLAILFFRGSRRATTWLAGYQALCLWGAGLALDIHLGADGHFAPLVTNLVLPCLLLVMLLRLRGSASAAGAGEVDHPVALGAQGGPVGVQP
jgi:hypothetical protein